MLQDRHKPTAGNGLIVIEGILGRSADRQVFLAFASAEMLHAISFADVLDEDTGTPALLPLRG